MGVTLTIAVLLGSAMCITVQAEQPRVKQEREKAARVAALMAKHQWRTAEPAPVRPQFCAAFLAALKSASSAIRYVEPVLRTDNPEHSGLRRYRQPCIAPDNRAGASEFSGLWRVGDRGFRVYRVDLDQNPANGLEEMIYGEFRPETIKKLGFGSGYYRVDLEKCVYTEDGASGSQDLQADGRNFDNYNALVEYQGRYYIYDLFQLGADKPVNYRLNVSSAQTSVTKEGWLCGWNTFK
jgi:hypothetical protein